MAEERESDDKTAMITIVSSNGDKCVIPFELVMYSGTLKAMLNSGGNFEECSEQVCHLKNISTPVLNKVIEYFQYKKKYQDADPHNVPEFKVEREIVMDLLMAANYLDC